MINVGDIVCIPKGQSSYLGRKPSHGASIVTIEKDAPAIILSVFTPDNVRYQYGLVFLCEGRIYSDCYAIMALPEILERCGRV